MSMSKLLAFVILIPKTWNTFSSLYKSTILPPAWLKRAKNNLDRSKEGNKMDRRIQIQKLQALPLQRCFEWLKK
jgi:hypothetical protein